MPEQAEKNGSLTTREREIVLLAATGLSNKAIAYELKLSEGTVKVHMHNIFQKLGIRTRSGLIIQADLSVQRTADGSAQLADRRELTLQSWAR
ncbi:MAG: response regulator transcription factor [Steroidobacteraceae bacterium]|jgi:DNA-binding NarL/FixJ family response regulator